MGGKKRSKTTTELFDPSQVRATIGGLMGVQTGLQGQDSFAFDPGSVSRPGEISSITQLQQGGLTPEEQSSIQEQLAAVTLGATGAEQQISQTVREQAEARGLGSSRGAIAQEAAQLANIPLAQAQQRAGILGQAGQLRRQGLLAGSELGLRQQQLGLQAEQFTAEQGLRAQQLQQQSEQQRIQQQIQALLGAGQLGATTLSTTRGSGGGGFGGLVGGLVGASIGGPAGFGVGSQIGSSL